MHGAGHRDRWRRGALASVLAGVLLVASACTSGTDTSTTQATTPLPTTPVPAAVPGTAGMPVPAPITWSACDDGLDCATVPVPADPDAPDGATVALAVTRRRASGPETARLGPLIVHPGGPGASTRSLVAADGWPDEILERFDLIGIDPRGVGGSEPLACSAMPAVRDFRRLDGAPTSTDARADLEAAARTASEACATTDGARLDQLRTSVAVDDIEAVRRALGVEQLSFAVFSYGTAVGLAYADEHGARVRAMVLDGVIDPELDLLGLLTGQATELERALHDLDAACTPTNRCAVDDLLGAYDAAEVALAGVAADDGTGAAVSTLRFATIAATYEPRLGARLDDALAAALAGDRAPLDDLADVYEQSGDYAAYLAYLCADLAHPTDPRAWTDAVAAVRDVAPRLGATVLDEVLPCATWPVTAPGPAPRRAADAPPILVVGATGDAATPLAWSEAVAEDLDHGALVTYHGAGHTSTFRSPCVAGAVTAYLLDPAAVRDDVTC